MSRAQLQENDSLSRLAKLKDENEEDGADWGITADEKSNMDGVWAGHPRNTVPGEDCC